MVAGVRIVKCSANEVMTLASKAARGAGAPPAQAAAFGRAAERHLIAGRAPSDLTTALEQLPEGPVLDLPLAIARIIESSSGETASGEIEAQGFADLLLSYAESQLYAINAVKSGDMVKLNLTFTEPNLVPAVARVALPDDMAQYMQSLASRILVPESEASRSAGAGSGLTDND